MEQTLDLDRGLELASFTHPPRSETADYQERRHSLQLHWSVPIAAVADRLPLGLELDAWAGQAVVTVAFAAVSPRRGSALPSWLAGERHELELRTYVRSVAGRGTYVLRRETTSRVASWASRAEGLAPAGLVRIDHERDAGVPTRYEAYLPCREPLFRVRASCGADVDEVRPGTLESFVLRRRYAHFVIDGCLHRCALRTSSLRVGYGMAVVVLDRLPALAGLPPLEPLPHACHALDGFTLAIGRRQAVAR